MPRREEVLDCLRQKETCTEAELEERLGSLSEYVRTIAHLLEEGVIEKVDHGYRLRPGP